MRTTFLHLSDLHYRPEWPEQIGLVFDKFIEDLKRELNHFEKPYLIFSGDLVREGEDPASYAAFHENIVAPLDQIGLTRDRRIVVPGNHDVSRMALKNKIGIIRGALSELSSEESFLNELPALTSDLFKSKFDPYIEAEDKFAAMTCCHSHLGGAGWDLPGDIGVYCLNSALCSFAGLNDPKTGEKIIDKELLSIDTRTLYQ